MAKTAALSLRVPGPLKSALVARAKRSHRSLAAQVTSDLEKVITEDTEAPFPKATFFGIASHLGPVDEVALRAGRKEIVRGLEKKWRNWK